MWISLIGHRVSNVIPDAKFFYFYLLDWSILRILPTVYIDECCQITIVPLSFNKKAFSSPKKFGEQVTPVWILLIHSLSFWCRACRVKICWLLCHAFLCTERCVVLVNGLASSVYKPKRTSSRSSWETGKLKLAELRSLWAWTKCVPSLQTRIAAGHCLRKIDLKIRSLILSSVNDNNTSGAVLPVYVFVLGTNNLARRWHPTGMWDLIKRPIRKSQIRVDTGFVKVVT